ncbi:hypothetical protein E2F50_13205 [Rhizobium deserti]|uniref:Uncharacterized protein n=1 Tax=Rhizobium deserti TaxID=2547961 RepID=A0A4R5UGY2_9HYPH|nr:hypothetical protein [Rhizobium deserti]TDK35210.1 hypothetical protein E2F50_13205 [Rhizobium deserti]
MIPMWNLEPDDMPALKASLTNEANRKTFLQAVRRFLESVKLDGGADSDLIYTTGLLLAHAAVWEDIPAEALARELSGHVAPGALSIFLDSADIAYKLKALHQLSSTRREGQGAKGANEQVPLVLSRYGSGAENVAVGYKARLDKAVAEDEARSARVRQLMFKFRHHTRGFKGKIKKAILKDGTAVIIVDGKTFVELRQATEQPVPPKIGRFK